MWLTWSIRWFVKAKVLSPVINSDVMAIDYSSGNKIISSPFVMNIHLWDREVHTTFDFVGQPLVFIWYGSQQLSQLQQITSPQSLPTMVIDCRVWSDERWDAQNPALQHSGPLFSETSAINPRLLVERACEGLFLTFCPPVLTIIWHHFALCIPFAFSSSYSPLGASFSVAREIRLWIASQSQFDTATTST